jgi:hypothetical protein
VCWRPYLFSPIGTIIATRYIWCSCVFVCISYCVGYCTWHRINLV